MFNDRVQQAISDMGLQYAEVVEEENKQLEAMAGPDARKLFREARIFREQANLLDTQACIAHDNKRRQQLYREASVAHKMADRYEEEARVIAHHGIKGQQWGVRRTKKQLASASKKASSEKSLKKKARSMSDEDLRANINRLKLEKEYVTLTQQANSRTKSRMQRGKEEMTKIAKQSTKNALTKHGTAIVTQGLTVAIKKASPSYQAPKIK